MGVLSLGCANILLTMEVTMGNFGEDACLDLCPFILGVVLPVWA